jgi:environmental stress-induced protein Ves
MRPGAALTRLDSARYRRTPWKNGGGVTVDIAGVSVPGVALGAWEGVIWRFGQTRIERPGPFSDLSGFDRLLAVVEGQGLVLHPAGAPALDVRERFHPVRFPGEWQIESELEDGPVAVVNLMADRRRAAIDLRFTAGITRLAFEPGTLVLYAAAGASTVELSGGDSIELAPADAVQVESDEPIAITVRSGVIAAASIRALSPR